MVSHKFSFFYLSVTTILFPVFLAPPLASGDILWQECVPGWNYTANSTYQSNLIRLSTTLPRKAASSPTLFATDTAGAVPDTIYALTLCRGDANTSACAACVANAFRDAQQVCPYSMDVTVYYDPCYLRFSNQNFLASILNTKQHIMPNGENVTTSSPPGAFDAAVGDLLDAVVDYAVRNSTARFDTGVMEGFDVSNPKIYAMAQCTPDLSTDDCRACLNQIVSVMPKHFGGRQGGRILGLRCNYRFQLYPPFSGSALLQIPAPGTVVAPPSGGGGGTRIKLNTILAIALAIVSSTLAFTLVCFCVWKRSNKPQGFLPSDTWHQNTSYAGIIPPSQMCSVSAS